MSSSPLDQRFRLVNMAFRHYNGTYQTILIDSGLQWEIMGRSGRLATALIHRDTDSARSPGPRIKRGDPAVTEREI
ncbi:hypothetical protein BGW80DRAFT_1329345 [Lactifluus volemus]|nr:hypothetical protein BGW80DRAFT_1329345 [Lactifluus volemus]